MSSWLYRREFLKDAGAFAVSTALLVSNSSALAAAIEPSPPRINTVLYDERYSDCRDFADAFVERGATPFRTGRDVASLWHRSLREHVAKYGGGLAGLTPYSDLVVLRSYVAELKLGLMYEGSHDCRTSAGIVHQFRVRGDGREIGETLSHSNAGWAWSLAAVLGRTNANSVFPSSASEVRGSRTATGHPGYLVSWVFA